MHILDADFEAWLQFECGITNTSLLDSDEVDELFEIFLEEEEEGYDFYDW